MLPCLQEVIPMFRCLDSLEDLERLRGLKHYQESKIEVAHQVGKRVDLMFCAVNDTEKKIECSLRFQHTMEKASMRLIQEEAKDKQSRKRTTDEIEQHDNDRASQLLLLLMLPEIDDEFPTLLKLAVVGRKNKTAVDVDDEEWRFIMADCLLLSLVLTATFHR